MAVYLDYADDLSHRHMYVLAPDHLWYLSLRPEGVGQVQLRFGVALAPEVHAALGDDARAMGHGTRRFL